VDARGAAGVTGVDDGALGRSLCDLSDRLDIDAPVEPLGLRLAAVVSAATELLHVDSVGLVLLDDVDRVRSVASTGRAAEVLEKAQERITVGPGIDALTGEMVAVADLAAVPRYGALWREVAGQGVRAVLSAPIRVGEDVVGNLNALVRSPHTWSAAQRRSAEAFAGIVGELLGLAAREKMNGEPRR